MRQLTSRLMIVLALLACAPSAQGQAVNPAMSPAFLQAQQQEIAVSRDVAEQARQRYADYQQRVSAYIDELQQRCDEAHALRQKVEGRMAELEVLAHGQSGDELSRSRAEMESLKGWLAAESKMSAQAASNVDLCRRWLEHTREQVNIANYNAAEDEQKLRDEQLKLRQAQEALTRQQEQMRDHEYWQNRDAEPYYGGYLRHGRRLGFGGRHYSSGHPGGGGGGQSATGGGHSTFRSGGGHHR